MGLRYIFQIIAMLIAPLVTFCAIFVAYEFHNIIVTIIIGYFYFNGLDMWDPWKPKIAKKFLANTKAMGL